MGGSSLQGRVSPEQEGNRGGFALEIRLLALYIGECSDPEGI